MSSGVAGIISAPVSFVIIKPPVMKPAPFLPLAALFGGLLPLPAQNAGILPPPDDFPDNPPGFMLPLQPTSTGGRVGGIGGRVDSSTDLDCFGFFLDVAATVTIYTTGTTDTRGVLRAGNLEVLVTEDSGTAPFRLQRLLPAGQYFLQVGGRPVSGTTNSYALRVEAVPAVPNPPPPPPPDTSGEIDVKLGSAAVPSGGTVDFGSVPMPSSVTVVRELVVSNTATTDLRLGSASIVSPAGATNASVFRVLTQPATTVLPGRTTVIRVGIPGGMVVPAGPVRAEVVFNTSDADENPYRIQLQAEIVPPPPPPSPPDIAVGPPDSEIARGSSVDLGTVPVGGSLSREIPVRNTGAGDLRIASVVVGNATAVAGQPGILPLPPFRIEGGGSQTIAPGAAGSFRVIFAPTVAGTFGALVSIASNDPDEQSYQFVVKGATEGGEPPPPPPGDADIAVALGDADLAAGDAVAFGSTPATVPVRRELKLSNKGTSPLLVRAAIRPKTAAVRGTTLPPFRFGSPASLVIEPGATRPMVIVFAPTAAGEFEAGLILTSNDPDENPLQFKMVGTGGNPDPGAAPDIALSNEAGDLATGAAVDFGSVDPGRTAVRSLTVRNTGSNDLRLGRFTLERPSAPEPVAGAVAPPPSFAGFGFRVAPPPVAVVPPGGSAVLRVSFTAPAFGAQAAVLKIASNDPDENPFVLRLAGASTGTPPLPPEIALASGDAELPMNGTLDFGSVVIGTPVVREIKVTNSGQGPLRLQGFSFQPAEPPPPVFVPLGAAGDVIRPPFPWPTPVTVRVVSGTTLIAPGASAVIRLQLSGFAAGSATLRARLFNNDADENPYTFDIKATVSAPEPPVEPVSPPGEFRPAI